MIKECEARTKSFILSSSSSSSSASSSADNNVNTSNTTDTTTPYSDDGVSNSKRSTAKPWRLSRAAIAEEQTSTHSLLHTPNSSPPVHTAAVVFCYEADLLLDQLSLPLLPEQEMAREAIDAFRMLATNGGRLLPRPQAPEDSNQEVIHVPARGFKEELEAARKLDAQSLKEIGLESAMREALKRTPPGKWPVMHEIVRGIWHVFSHIPAYFS